MLAISSGGGRPRLAASPANETRARLIPCCGRVGHTTRRAPAMSRRRIVRMGYYGLSAAELHARSAPMLVMPHRLVESTYTNTRRAGFLSRARICASVASRPRFDTRAPAVAARRSTPVLGPLVAPARTALRRRSATASKRWLASMPKTRSPQARQRSCGTSSNRCRRRPTHSSTSSSTAIIRRLPQVGQGPGLVASVREFGRDGDIEYLLVTLSPDRALGVDPRTREVRALYHVQALARMRTAHRA